MYPISKHSREGCNANTDRAAHDYPNLDDNIRSYRHINTSFDA